MSNVHILGARQYAITFKVTVPPDFPQMPDLAPLLVNSISFGAQVAMMCRVSKEVTIEELPAFNEHGVRS